MFDIHADRPAGRPAVVSSLRAFPHHGFDEAQYLTPDEAERALLAFLHEHQEPAYRARQVLHHLWERPAPDFASMSELPLALRARLAESFDLPRLPIDTRQVSRDGTQKFLFRLGDGQAIEAVAIPEGDRLTLCVSSQAGCALQCAFCATGAMGFARNLRPFEIAGQVRELAFLDPPVQVVSLNLLDLTIAVAQSPLDALPASNESSETRGEAALAAASAMVSELGPGVEASVIAFDDPRRLPCDAQSPCVIVTDGVMPIHPPSDRTGHTSVVRVGEELSPNVRLLSALSPRPLGP